MLQNSINIEEYTVNFKHVYNIFNLKYASTDGMMKFVGFYKVEKEDLNLNQINVVDLNEIFSITTKEDIEELFITLKCNL